MLNIEIAIPDRMSQSGSSLLRLIQNNNMPILDLLVRESVQNSLDAYEEKSDYIGVDFTVGSFNSQELNCHLESIEDKLNKIYENKECRYISIKDYKTKGLTGELHFDNVVDNHYGNLLKLIYEISKAQESEGAGGSWGLGKTVYFRVGIGMVIYYSRIKLNNGEYQARLAASMVENEKSEETIIPVYRKKNKRGIAWWGEKIGENKTQPITDEKVINNFLKVFNIKPYSGSETGTTIIIPYIDEKKLLETNQIEYSNNSDERYLPFWQDEIKEYLKISLQRWYSPRINNKQYKYGKYLQASVNGDIIKKDDMESIFKVMQCLYNRASLDKTSFEDYLTENNIEVKTNKINLRNVLVKSAAGKVSYVRISKALLSMLPPSNKPNPYIYLNKVYANGETNKPIVTFCRQPGMVVSYEVVGDWVNGIASTNQDEFIIAFFALKSENKFSDMENLGDLKLEEYIRKSEMADHTSWSDFSIGKQKISIVNKIQRHIVGKISEAFSEIEDVTDSSVDYGLGKKIGDILLPPKDFGKMASSTAVKKVEEELVEKTKSYCFKIDMNSIKYLKNTMSIDCNLTIFKVEGKVEFYVSVQSETGRIPLEDWENEFVIEPPFEINELIFNKNKNEKSIASLNAKNKKISLDGIDFQLLQTNSKFNYGMSFSKQTKDKFSINFKLILDLLNREFRPVFEIKVVGDE